MIATNDDEWQSIAETHPFRDLFSEQACNDVREDLWSMWGEGEPSERWILLVVTAVSGTVFMSCILASSTGEYYCHCPK